jgi:hypothetical protein
MVPAIPTRTGIRGIASATTLTRGPSTSRQRYNGHGSRSSLAPALQLGHRVVDAEAVGGEIGEKTIDETAKLGGTGSGSGVRAETVL